MLFKNGPTFCIVTPMKRWVAVGFSLRRRLDTGRLSRKVSDGGSRFYHVVNIDDPDDVDDELLAWLTEAYNHGDPDAADAYRGDEQADELSSSGFHGPPSKKAHASPDGTLTRAQNQQS